MFIEEKDFPTVRTRLASFIREEIHRSGRRKAVLGLSGGLDSAVVAYLCAEALGAENVLCLILPVGSSDRRNIDDAHELADRLGVRKEELNIDPAVDALVATDPGMNRVRRGNIAARVRMILLYDRSARDNALVVGTGNRTEILLGYYTLHGDGACAINPIGRLYKTEVRRLARHLGVPEKIIGKAPSADLWKGQTDEGELGFTYGEADEILHSLVDEKMPVPDVVSRGYRESVVRSIEEKMQSSRFKRQPPSIAPMGDRS
ncbi:MAG: NAD+ synthase [Bacteroidota bacterium]|nr:NAD+ synthase [Bacteroidota bacterium]